MLTNFARLIPALALTPLALTMKADTATNKSLCVATYWSSGDWSLKQTPTMLPPSVTIK